MDVWVLVPVLAIVMWGLQGIARARHGRGGDVRALRDEVQALRADVERLGGGDANAGMEGRLLELEERVDFAERLLARQEPRLPASDR